MFWEIAVWRIWVCFGNPGFGRLLLHLPPRRRVAAGCRIKSGRRVGGGGCFTVWLCFGIWPIFKCAHLGLFRESGFRASAASSSATQTRGCWMPDQVRQEGWWWGCFTVWLCFGIWPIFKCAHLGLFRESGFRALAASSSATQTRGCWMPDQVRQEGWWWRVFHNLALFRDLADFQMRRSGFVSGFCVFSQSGFVSGFRCFQPESINRQARNTSDYRHQRRSINCEISR